MIAEKMSPPLREGLEAAHGDRVFRVLVQLASTRGEETAEHLASIDRVLQAHAGSRRSDPGALGIITVRAPAHAIVALSDLQAVRAVLQNHGLRRL